MRIIYDADYDYYENLMCKYKFCCIFLLLLIFPSMMAQLKQHYNLQWVAMETIAIDRTIGQIKWAAAHLIGDLHTMVSTQFIEIWLCDCFFAVFCCCHNSLLPQ